MMLFVVYLRLVTHKKIKPTAAPEGNEQLLLRCLKQCLLGGVPIVRLCSARLTARIPESQLWRRFVMWSSEKLKHVYHWLSCCFSLSHCQQDYLGAGAIIGCPSVCPRGGGRNTFCETLVLYLSNFAWDGAGTETWTKLSWHASGLLKRKLRYTRGAVLTRQNSSEESFGGVACVVVQRLLGCFSHKLQSF